MKNNPGKTGNRPETNSTPRSIIVSVTYHYHYLQKFAFNKRAQRVFDAGLAANLELHLHEVLLLLRDMGAWEPDILRDELPPKQSLESV